MPSRRVLALAVAPGLVVLAARCSTTTGLPAANFANVVDTVSLFALSGTPVAEPSAYLLDGRQRVRTDQSSVLDFAFDFDTLTHKPELLPTAVLRLGALSSLQRTGTPFDLIKIAPTGSWLSDSALVVDTGMVVLVRSRPTTCVTGISVSLYAKLQVLAIDTSSAPGGRRIDFKILVDQNCGYRSLAPGTPTQ